MSAAPPELDLARTHHDPYAGDLPALAVDRQRVIHSAAFRRLQHKTQVFAAAPLPAGAPPDAAPATDHFRSRLTHTLEVANVARLLADRLGLNAALAEIVALAHDLGHPPFGHAGERVLDECLAPLGGFNHNAHSLRVVETLEHPYPQFIGLNLTRAVRSCLAAHATPYDRPADAAHAAAPPESAVVDLADRLAYALHDLQDGLYAGLIDADALDAAPLWRDSYAGPRPVQQQWRGRLRPTVDRMQQTLLARVALAPDNAPRLDDAGAALLAPLEDLLRAQLYRHPALQAADAYGGRVLAELFEAYLAAPDRLPPRFAKRLAGQPAPQVIADYLAGMTDRYCLQTHADLTGSR